MDFDPLHPPQFDLKRATGKKLVRELAAVAMEENALLRSALQITQERLAKYEGTSDEVGELQRLREQLWQRNSALFAATSERRHRDEAPPSATDAPTGDQPEAEKKARQGHGPKAQDGLTKRVLTSTLPEGSCCPACSSPLVPLEGQFESSELVAVAAACFELLVKQRQKYRCPCNGAVVTAPEVGPEPVVKGGRYSLHFAAYIANAKYNAHLPFERISRLVKHDGLTVTAQTLWDQVDALAELLAPTFQAILASLREAKVLGADETSWPLLANQKGAKGKKSYQVWAMTDGDLVAYLLLEGRGLAQARVLLDGFKGTLVSDGYQPYKSLASEFGYRLAHCWAHARRKFVEAEAGYPEATVALDAMGELYGVERQASGLAPTALLALRQKAALPLVDQLFAWAKALPVLKGSSLATAVAYLLNHEAALRTYLTDGSVPIDNNWTERALRSPVLGRKNHQGSRSTRGTEVAAICYTLVSCAQLAGVSPVDYLVAVAEGAKRSPGAVLLPKDFKARKEANTA